MIHRYIKVKTTGISLFVDLVVARVLNINYYSEVRKSDKGANSFQIQLQLIHIISLLEVIPR